MPFGKLRHANCPQHAPLVPTLNLINSITPSLLRLHSNIIISPYGVFYIIIIIIIIITIIIIIIILMYSTGSTINNKNET